MQVVAANEYQASFWGDENILELVTMFVQTSKCTKTTEMFTLKQ